MLAVGLAATDDDDARLTAVLTGPAMYGYLNQRRLVMVLAAVELERRQSTRVEDIYTLPTNLTIEHVMPRSWGDHWPLDGEGQDKDERQARIDRLGNLTLTSGALNSSMSNAAWGVKRPELAKSLLQLNHDITANLTWDEATICREVVP